MNHLGARKAAHGHLRIDDKHDDTLVASEDIQLRSLAVSHWNRPCMRLQRICNEYAIKVIVIETALDNSILYSAAAKKRQRPLETCNFIPLSQQLQSH